jgi:hypothetical protein
MICSRLTNAHGMAGERPHKYLATGQFVSTCYKHHLALSGRLGVERCGTYQAIFAITDFHWTWLMNTNLCEFLDDAAGRRLWLLIKALENAPLREALALAKGAEAFLAGRADASQERGIACHSPGLQLSTSIH